MTKTQCQAIAKNTNQQCSKSALFGSLYCWAHYPKKEPILLMLLSTLLGVFLTVLFAESLLPWVSIHVVNREHLLDIQIRELPIEYASEKRLLTMNLTNNHSSFCVEDINLNVGFTNIIEKIITSDSGVLDYEISQGRDSLIIQTDKVEKSPSNNRNIKIRKIFPDSALALSVFLNTKKSEGSYDYNPSDSKSVKYSIEYSYKFWGSTVRRKIENKEKTIAYSNINKN